MIERLFIQNLILIERAEIHFGKKLNILTGETGAGKSAILSAIQLILGERADLELIRKGQDLAIVEATVRIPHKQIEGLSLPLSGFPICIRRELHASGRSRCFIQDQQISLQELRTIVTGSIEMVSQSKATGLCEIDSQRRLLDTFARMNNSDFAEQFTLLCKAQKQQDELLTLQQKGGLEIDRANEDLKNIQEVNWRKDEEETLEQEHHLLIHAQELIDKISSFTTFLSEGSQPVLSTFKRFIYQLEQLERVEPKLKECSEGLRTSIAHLEEVRRFLVSYMHNLDINPQKLFTIELRMGQIESIKRKFGKTYEDVEALKHSLEARCYTFANLDSRMELTQRHLEETKKETLKQATVLTKRRKEAAIAFSELCTQKLKKLNLPDARFSIQITEKNLSEQGADEITYLFAANPGLPLLPLDTAISGGELSRLLFAIKTTLANKDQAVCLVFDEIDSNVGGKTATIFGEQLQSLAETKQIIAVTHFIQVAKCATDHFLVSKTTTQESAVTQIAKLAGPAQEKEYARMIGS